MQKEDKIDLYRMVSQNYWYNVFTSTTNGSTWWKNQAISPGRWAVGYSVFYLLYRFLNENKPASVMEFGLGEMTRMLQEYKKNYQPNAICTTVEHNKEWIKIKESIDLDSSIMNVVHCESKQIRIDNKYRCNIYVDLLATIDKKHPGLTFNMIVIDGPIGSRKLSRYDVIDIIENDRLAKDFIIIMDDFNRIGEKRTAEAIMKTLTKKGINFFTGEFYDEKDIWIVTSESLRHFTTI